MHGPAGHTAAQVLGVRSLLDAERARDEPIPVIEYYLRAQWREPDLGLDDPSKVKARDAGEAHAADGRAALVRRLGDAVRDLAQALDDEPADRVVPVPWAGCALTLDGYLTTRLLELVVHVDDLAVSAGTDTPALDPAAVRAVLDILVELSVDRHGPMAVLRALSRAERAQDSIAAL